MAKGVGGTGVGFDAPSAGRLGSHAWIPVHNPPEGRLHDHALKVGPTTSHVLCACPAVMGARVRACWWVCRTGLRLISARRPLPAPPLTATQLGRLLRSGPSGSAS